MSKKAPQGKVRCDSCRRLFKEVFPGGAESEQGYKCAATVNDDCIVGHYGSTVADMTMYRWIQRPKWVKNGTICDFCIQRLEDGKKIEAEKGSFW